MNNKIISLKIKFVIVSVLLTLGLISVLVFFTFSFYLNNIKSLEEETIQTNIERGKSAFDYVIQNFNTRLNDWAQWDDTYQFMEDFNDEYVKSNLNSSTLENLHTDEMIFFGVDFKHKYSIATDKVLEIEKDFPEDTENFLLENDRIMDDLKSRGVSTGVIKTEDGNLVYVVQRILDSHGQGDARGYLMFGRYIDKWIEEDMSFLIQLPVKLISDQDVKLSENTESVFGYFNIQVYKGDSDLIFRIEIDRNIWKLGYRSAIYQTIVITLLAVFIGLCNYLFLRFVILKDISKFKDDVVALSKDTTGRLNLVVDSNNLEIRVLQEKVSELITNLNIAKKESETKAEELVQINSLMVGREIKMSELKNVIEDLKKKII